MSVQQPTLDQLEQIALDFGLSFSPETLSKIQGFTQTSIASYARLDQLTEPSLPVKYPRTPGYRPQPEDNPYNAWYWKTAIKGSPTGKLAGKTIALKDNICLAGVPMMNGCALVEGYVPEIDATVATRILEAGGEIAGKAVCTNLCVTLQTDTGYVRNPHDETRSASGSSSGSAALVAGGVVDMALGGDQGGSIRLPAAWCGIVGLKPTYGLVPYTGIFPIELTLDHTGPMTRSVTDCGLLLEAIAGSDGLDPRQYSVQVADSYTNCLTGEANGLRVGIVKEGFGWEGLSEPDVDEIIKAAAYRLEKVGAKVDEISIPMHRDAGHILFGILIEGTAQLMIKGNSMGTNWKGHYTTSLLDAYGRSWQTRPNDLPSNAKYILMMAQYMQEGYQGRYYAKAQNLARILRSTYDQLLREYDVLIMPTCPIKATKLPPPGSDYFDPSFGGIASNTGAFNVTGHPSISINAGLSEGLPVGMMITGRYWDECTVLRVAHAFEQLG